VAIERAGEDAEMDEMWSFVGHKGNPRWLWHAIGAPCKRYGGMSQDLEVYRYPLSRWG
jgi:IS1 transposase